MKTQHTSPTGRRGFLRRIGTVAAGLPALWIAKAGAAGGARHAAGLIARIERQVLWNGRKGGGIPTWFHPRACVVSHGNDSEVLMTVQTIGGSDVFGPVHWTSSHDLGRTWTKPRPIPGLGRRRIDGQLAEGTCDVVPDYHRPTNTVLAAGHNVYYCNGRLAQPQGPRWPVYVIRQPDGRWTRPKKLVWDDPRGTAIYTSGCSQRVILPDGRVLLPMSFGPKGRRDRAVAVALCHYDGRTLSIARTGNELRNSAGRGLLEPSLARFADRFYLTIRAEDGRGYVSRSADGLQWEQPQPWCWTTGEPLTMSTTQQHWLVHSDGLFLVYTRRAENNVNVFRWRAPLFVAQVDPETLRLIPDTEQVVLPLLGDGVNDAKHVARMGNFHVTNVSPEQSWVTVGETLPHDGWRGDLLLARIFWKRPNRTFGHT